MRLSLVINAKRLMGSVSTLAKMSAAKMSHFSKEGGTVGEAIRRFNRSDNNNEGLGDPLPNTSTRLKDNEFTYLS